jgi:penicillin amidase
VDNTDLFLEEIGPDGVSVREGDRFVPCGVRSESIVVKGGQDVVEQVLVTRRGPIIGPALEGGFQAVSLMATWLREEPLERLFEPYRAGSFQEFRKAFAQWPCPPQNMVYADSSGTIGWLLVGKAPRRRKGRGTIPLPGWDQEVGWHEDPIPFDEMPWLENPEHGFVATANTLATPRGENPYLGVDCIDGYRLSRLVEVLGSRNDWDRGGVRALQMDEKSMVWQELRETLLRVPTRTDEVRLALELLESQPGTVSLDSPAATIFEMFIAEMSRRVALAKAPRSSEWALGKSTNRIAPYNLFVVRRVGHLVRLLREQPEVWFDAPWPDVMADALTQVVRTLQSRFGPDPKGWAWGVCRPLTLRHLLGERTILRGIFNLGPFPFGGDTNTVNQAAVPPQDALGNPLAIASLRAVIDVGDWDVSLFSLPGGQSGNPLSPHYDDLLPFWVRGDGVPVAWSDTAVKNLTRSVLRLIPS